MQVLLASDHAGYELRKKIETALRQQSIEVVDLGPQSQDSVDYTDFAKILCSKLEPQEATVQPISFGILICGSGQGMAIKANKYSHIRAALCWDLVSTQLSREHNNANVLCLGGRLLPHGLALEMVDVFLKTPFLGGRHKNRVEKLSQ